MAHSQKMVRLGLTAGILIVLALTFWVKLSIEKKKNARLLDQEEDPEHQAALAISKADEALLQNHPDLALAEFQHAIELWEKMEGETPKWNALATRDRALQLLKTLGRNSEARQWAETVFTQSRALFQAAPTESRRQKAYLSAAKNVSSVEDPLHRRHQPDTAEAALEVDATSNIAPLEALVLGELSNCFLDAAKRYAEASATDDALALLEKATTNAKKAAPLREDPSEALMAQERVAVEAMQIAEMLADRQRSKAAKTGSAADANAETADQKDADAGSPAKAVDLDALADRYGRMALDALDLELEFAPEARVLKQRQAALYLRLADRGAKSGGNLDAVTADYAAAVRLRRALRDAGDVKEQRNLVRTLEAFGIWKSRQRQGLEILKEAVTEAKTLDQKDLDIAASVYGQLAKALSDQKKFVEARSFAKEAYDAATTFAQKQGKTGEKEWAIAALRYARLLRMKPNPQKSQALEIAQKAKAQLKNEGSAPAKGGASKEMEALIRALDALIDELKSVK